MYGFLIPLYDIVFILVSVRYIIKYAFRKRLKKYLFQRFLLPEKVRRKLKGIENPIWVHAVSVGEVKVLSGILDRIREKYPHKQIVLSVVTDQGKFEADRLYSKKAIVFYLPLDISFVIKPVVTFLNPALFVSAETEIWPNLYYFLNKKNVPIIILNARISDESFAFYRLARVVLKDILRKVNFVGAQDEIAKRRFFSLGVKEKFVEVTGNMKYKSLQLDSQKLEEVKSRWGRLKNKGELLLVAGSTHHPEEEIFTDIYGEFLKYGLDIRLLLCPRHLERVSEITKLLNSKGFIPKRVSKGEIPSFDKGEREVFILDTMGQLVYFYSLADIVFVGGSLAKYGGHNVLEPAYFGVPILVGPYTFNFKDIINNFLKNKALLKINSSLELKEKLFELIGNKRLGKELGRNAKKVIEKSENSLDNNMAVLEKFLK